MGTQRIGRYEVVRRLALGGMAELFLGRVAGLSGFEKFVAVKRILPHLAGDQDFVAMFRREARIAASLEHPNIVHVSDLGHDGRDYYLVMPYLVGKDLLAITRELDRRGESIPLQHAIAIVCGIAEGLDYAHHKTDANGQPLGIVHRDVSPSNIFVTYRGEIKLLDFGIARASAEIGITRPGVRKGKMRYMSPEQCLDLPLDGRSDVFCLAVVLYELTTGRRLFDPENESAAIEQIVRRPIAAPSHWVPAYPKDLEQILMRALARDRDHRYPTARQFRLDLEQFAHDARLRATPLGVGEWAAELFGEPVGPVGVPEPLPPPPSSPLLGPVHGPFMLANDPMPRVFEPAPRIGVPAPVVTSARPTSRRRGEIAAVAIIVGASLVAVLTAGAWWWRHSQSLSTESSAAQDNRALLVAVNETDRRKALGFRERHAALDALRADRAAFAEVDMRLQLALDLVQAADAPDPCATVEDALASVAKSGDPWFLEVLRTASTPAGCEGEAVHWNEVRAEISARDALSAAAASATQEARRTP
jgi:serine/threonine protein kinase